MEKKLDAKKKKSWKIFEQSHKFENQRKKENRFHVSEIRKFDISKN